MNDDLIRRGELETVVEKLLLGIADPYDLIKTILDVPAVDAVEVVRCGECLHHLEQNGIDSKYCSMHDTAVGAEDFCSYGVRGNTMELKDLCGKHFLQGVGRGHTDAAETFLFRLDGVTYIAEEDPDDGYRSMMKSIKIVAGIPRYALNVEVMCSMCSNKDNDVLEMRDAQNGEIILRVGTSHEEKYYPFFVAEWMPEKMECNFENSISERTKAYQEYYNAQQDFRDWVDEQEEKDA